MWNLDNKQPESVIFGWQYFLYIFCQMTFFCAKNIFSSHVVIMATGRANPASNLHWNLGWGTLNWENHDLKTGNLGKVEMFKKLRKKNSLFKTLQFGFIQFIALSTFKRTVWPPKNQEKLMFQLNFFCTFSKFLNWKKISKDVSIWFWGKRYILA